MEFSSTFCGKCWGVDGVSFGNVGGVARESGKSVPSANPLRYGADAVATQATGRRLRPLCAMRTASLKQLDSPEDWIPGRDSESVARLPLTDR